MREMWEPIVTIAVAAIGLAVIAVLVSRNAQTPAVLSAAGGSFAGIIGAAESPVTGAGSGSGVPFTQFGLSPLGANIYG